jgi:putative redox protein
MEQQQNVRLAWQGQMTFKSVGTEKHSLTMDAGAEHGGADSGLRPMEVLLTALGGCTAMDVISILQKKRQQVTAFELRLDAERQAEHPRVYTQIKITYILTGNRLDPAAVERAIELSATKYCPVQAMLAPTVKITTTYEIHEAMGR